MLRDLKEGEREPADFPVTPERLGGLIKLIDDNTISGNGDAGFEYEYELLGGTLTITGNTFSGNDEAAVDFDGDVKDATIVISDNEMAGDEYGIQFDDDIHNSSTAPTAPRTASPRA